MSAFDKELPNLDIARARLGEDDVIRNVINRFILPARWRDAGNEIYLSHMIHMVLYRFMSLSVEGLDTLQNRVGGLAEKKAKEVEEFMRANLSEKLSVSQLAELTGMSVFHFLRSFKIRFSVTPYQYLSKLRLERAKNLLLTTQRPISDIALDCGFSNQSHLTMRFKKAIDLTPGQYRGCQRLFQ
ncbi:helix-turn-helix domain-containing protein [Aestuariispira insulae]|nr:AraC family transcriptional regulator [Aestuariispira insulae]